MRKDNGVRRMNKAEKKFRIYAILVIFVLLTVLLAVINAVNFTMAAQDADELTLNLAKTAGVFDQNGADPRDGQTMPDQNMQAPPDMQETPGGDRDTFDRGGKAPDDLQIMPDGGMQPDPDRRNSE